jgi:N-acetylmuramoyl-L-alanine amidase
MIETLLSILMAVTMLGAETPEDWAADRIWNSMSEEQRYEASIELKARSVGLSEEEFIFFSSVVEAESDRGYSDESQENRTLIALTIYNRMLDEDWPDTISGVLNQSGQFSVVSSGACWSVGRTNSSDMAILEAHRRLAEGDAPHVIYFNCIGYNAGTPYECVGDNYFMIA